jgi:hypothetical protein
VLILFALFAASATQIEHPITVRGRVTDETGKPLAGVEWWVSGFEEWREGNWQVVFRTGRTRKQTTDKDGRFEIQFHEKLRYELVFDKSDYGPVFLYQISADSPEIHVVMKKGLPLRGTVTRLGTGKPCVHATIVELRLPNPGGTWFNRSAPVGADGRFQFFVCPPPCLPNRSEAPKWQLVCAGEVVEIDVLEGEPIEEIHFQIDVKVSRQPAQNVDKK